MAKGYRSRRDYLSARKRAVEKYGGRCVTCGEEDWRLLDFDHVHNDGAARRAADPTECGQRLVYKLLREPRIRADLQCLCVVCHRLKGHYEDISA